MAYNESDDKLEILNEIHSLEKELLNLDERVYSISMRRKMIRHTISDLKYALSHPEHIDELYNTLTEKDM